MPTITCPLCLGPTELHVDGAQCAVGHSFDEAELVRALQQKADHALWAAMRSLEDQAAYGRIRRAEGMPLPPEVSLAEERVEALRNVMRGRAD
ncbi:MAG: hypothetical protein LC789_06410 [Actinobacteria bacterium]|nr:hypothetical protein [Actinomycetota bacterium]MCA1720442.1 hypothetical protein [Actinomycetota bacterium]